MKICCAIIATQRFVFNQTKEVLANISKILLAILLIY